MAFLFVQCNSRVVQSALKGLELLLLSAGLVFSLLMLKLAVMPYSCEMVFSSLMGFWNSIRCFLSSPLYIYLAINFMVLLIAASSTFHRRQHDNHRDDGDDDDHDHDHHVKIVESPVVLSPPPPPPSLPLDMIKTAPQEPPSLPQDIALTAPQPSYQDISKVAPSPPLPTKTTRRKIPTRITTTTSTLYQGGSSTHDDSPRTCHDSTEQINSTEKTNRYSPAALFNGALLSEDHEIKKASSNTLDSSPDLPVSTKEKTVITTTPPLQKEKEIHVEKEFEDSNNHLEDKENEEEDTMETTWNSIIGGGKQKPKKKQLKKSETWDVPPRRSTDSVQRLDSEELLPSTPRWRELRKSETFNDAVSITRRGGLRRDPSMSLEEFNKQVEAFIKKFNDNMRLQRQESIQRFLNMANRGY